MVKLSRRSFMKVTVAVGAAVAVAPQIFSGRKKTESLLKPVTAATASLISGPEVKVLTATTGAATWAYTNNGVLVRNESIHFSPEDLVQLAAGPQGQNFSWNGIPGGFPYEVPARTRAAPGAKNTGPWRPDTKVASWTPGHAARDWVYTPTRGQYPLKRVDWNPGGGSTSNYNPQNRGKSGYIRITWDEATTLIAQELARIKTNYGNGAFWSRGGFHIEWGTFSGREGGNFMAALGGQTAAIQVPNSWEGFAYGSAFVYGYNWLMGLATQRDALTDTLQNSDRIIFWGNDAFVTVGTYGGSFYINRWKWFRDLGFPIIAINPQLPFTAKLATKWIPIYPGTDAVMALAIAYTWIQEGTYDTADLATHAVGFDESTLPSGAPAGSSFKNYVLGLSDGVPKTAAWASAICGVPSRDIKALAREWATGNTSFNAYQAGLRATAFDYETCRLTTILQVMHGFGRPGKNMWTTGTGAPRDWRQLGLLAYGDFPMGMCSSGKYKPSGSVSQAINDQLVDQAVLGPWPVTWTGGNYPSAGMDLEFQKWTFPMPGYSKIHCIYALGTGPMHEQAELGRFVQIYQSPSIEDMFIQAPWFETDATYADIYLPVTTPFEREDLAEYGKASFRDQAITEYRGDWRVAIHMPKIIEPLFQSQNDYEIYCQVAQKIDAILGPTSNVYNIFTDGGKTREVWLEEFWNYAMAHGGNIPMTYEQFKAAGYYVFPFLSDYYTNPASGYGPGLQWFLNKPINQPSDGVSTPTGKFEIFSTQLYSHYGLNDTSAGVGAIPQWRPSWEGRYTTVAAPGTSSAAVGTNGVAPTFGTITQFPLQLMSHHPKMRYHGKYHQIHWMRDLWRITGPDGYQYEPIRMNPDDAAARGLKNHDIVKVWNNRGQILCAVEFYPIVQGATAV
ncbi:MAG: molybdopterin-dependent oxidoreductase, partial [Nitrososphaerota archaeon]|nr:molybdopterin-dependent oxidoreductase [Nitrososphaerota archaeon]